MQQAGGGPPAQSQYGAAVPVPPAEMTPPATAALTTHMLLAGTDQSQQQQQLVEEASPISSRPPATAAAGTLDEFMRLSGTGAAGLPDEDEADRAGGGVASGNRWPRQETLALLQIRSDMDAIFRDATVKGPLWEDVSRKLAELGYKRSAKKCKEKFENVHKYYKRTKEGRAGRQDGKSYRFFSQLEALHNTGGAATASTNVIVSASQPTPTTTTTLDVSPVSVGIPMPVSSVRPPPSTIGISSSSSMFPPDLTTTTMAPAAAAVSVPLRPPSGISFSSTSNGSSSSASSQDDFEDEPSNTAAGSSRKRKRQSSSSSKGGTTRRMMEFFEGLMKHVMQKQEAMQQRFLDAIEKREHDRMIREEAWKRQEMARLAREHDLMAQERAISASRDAAIIAFLQKITGQTIQSPPPVIVPTVPQPPPPPHPPPPPPQTQAVPLSPAVTTVSTQQPQPQPALVASAQQQNKKEQEQQHQQEVHHHQSSISIEVAMTLVPEQEVPPPQEIGSIESLEPTSTRWPKAEVLALIKLRSGLETKYQEVGPKGPLWEEISAGMQRMGYKRSAKRCKEKWENINKYFKKVKESNKKRPEDAKTCPYFHELDALYRKKLLGSSTSGFADQNRPEEPQQQQKDTMASDPAKPDNRSRDDVSASGLQSKNGGGADVNTGLPGSLFGEGNGGARAAKKPEDIMKELIKLEGTQKPPQQQQQQLMVHDYGKIDEGDDCEEDDVDDDGDNDDNDDDDEEEEESVDEDDEDDELEEERKMAYKIEFQRQNTSASNGGGNGAASFLAIVQ